MAVIHRTTLTPGKLELLSAWLPGRPWYRHSGPAPDLARAGGFRLDDPRGEAQAQRVSNTPDPTVICAPVSAGHLAVSGPLAVTDGPHGTEVIVQVTAADGRISRLILRVTRLLSPTAAPQGADQNLGMVSATWSLSDGSEACGLFAQLG